MKNIRGASPIVTLACLFTSVWMLVFPCMSSAEGEPKFPNSNAQNKCAIDEYPVKEEQSFLFPWELIKDKNLKDVYVALLRREHLKGRWLYSLNGPATKNRLLSIDGKRFVYIQSCKQHECNTHVVHLLFATQEKHIYGLLIENNSLKWIGSPPGCIKEALEMFTHK